MLRRGGGGPLPGPSHLEGGGIKRAPLWGGVIEPKGEKTPPPGGVSSSEGGRARFLAGHDTILCGRYLLHPREDISSPRGGIIRPGKQFAEFFLLVLI